jgi:hypothetical protein
MTHVIHPLTRACVECGDGASKIENSGAQCSRNSKPRHYVLIGATGTREVFIARGDWL